MAYGISQVIESVASYQTVYRNWFERFWSDGESLDMNDELNYPSYEYYYHPTEGSTFYPDPFAIKEYSKEEFRQWFGNRRSSFSTDFLRLNLVNQKSPIENFKIMLPQFSDDTFLYEFEYMKWSEVPKYMKFLNLQKDRQTCEQCRNTNEERPLGSCVKHQNEFRELVQEYQGIGNYQMELNKQSDYVERVYLFFNYLDGILKSLGRLISTKALSMQACNQKTVMTILPYLNWLSLKTICIQKIVNDNSDTPCSWIEPLEIDEICQSKQWKNARFIEIEHTIAPTDMKNFGHFSEVNVKLTWKGLLI